MLSVCVVFVCWWSQSKSFIFFRWSDVLRREDLIGKCIGTWLTLNILLAQGSLVKRLQCIFVLSFIYMMQECAEWAHSESGVSGDREAVERMLRQESEKETSRQWWRMQKGPLLDWMQHSTFNPLIPLSSFISFSFPYSLVVSQMEPFIGLSHDFPIMTLSIWTLSQQHQGVLSHDLHSHAFLCCWLMLVADPGNRQETWGKR